MGPQARAHHRGGEILGRGLAVRARDPDDACAGHAVAFVGREVEQRPAGGGDLDHGPVDARSMHERGHRPARERVLDERVTVRALPFDRDEQAARRRPRGNPSPPTTRRRPVRASVPRTADAIWESGRSITAPSRAGAPCRSIAARPRRPLDRRTRSSGPRAPGRSRAPCRRSRRRRRTTPVRIASRIAARRSGSTTKRPPPSLAPRSAPGVISAMIASGSSLRGLSLVTIARSAFAVAARPMSGRLARSRSPPAPSTTINRPCVSDRAARSTFSTLVGRVGVVDHHEEPLPHLDRLDAAGYPTHGRDRVRRDAVVDPERPSGRERGQRVLDVERPAQRRADRHAVGEEGDPLGRRVDLGGAHVRVGRDPVRDRRQAGGEPGSGRVRRRRSRRRDRSSPV